MSQLVVVDRIEGETAVLSPVAGGPPFDCPLTWLPEKLAEGATLRLARVAEAGMAQLEKADEAGVVITLPDGRTLGLRPELLPPGLSEGEALAFVEAPDVENARRLSIAERLGRLAERIDDELDL